MKILITGGSGFIGSRLAAKLIECGHEVITVDPARPPSSSAATPSPRHHYFSTQDGSLSFLFEAERPELVCHLAVALPLRVSIRKPVQDATGNILGTIKLLEACRTTGVRKIVFASSAVAAYGIPDRLPVDESHPVRPISHYGVSKTACEQYIRLYADLYGLDFTILRLATVYGPGQNTRMGAGVVSMFAEKVLKGQTPTIFGDGTKSRDYVFIDDVVRAFAASCTLGAGQTLNIGAGVPVQDRQIFDMVCAAAGVEMQPDFQPEQAGDLRSIYFDASLAWEQLGWASETALERGVAQVVEFYRSCIGQEEP